MFALLLTFLPKTRFPFLLCKGRSESQREARSLCEGGDLLSEVLVLSRSTLLHPEGSSLQKEIPEAGDGGEGRVEKQGFGLGQGVLRQQKGCQETQLVTFSDLFSRLVASPADAKAPPAPRSFKDCILHHLL